MEYGAKFTKYPHSAGADPRTKPNIENKGIHQPLIKYEKGLF